MIEKWLCEMCLEERDDRDISVLTYDVIIGGFPHAERNLRFCNDRDECRDRAIAKSHTKQI